jgi:excisionase family DNA binding protein
MNYVIEQERESTSKRVREPAQKPQSVSAPTSEDPAPTPEDKAVLDKILGNRALFFFDEAAPILRVSVPTLYRRAEDGRLEYVRVGRRRAITNSNMRIYARNGI